MKCLFVILFSVLHLLCRVCALSPIELSSSIIDESINDPSKDLWLIVYYDPNCGYSQEFLPIFEEIASGLHHLSFGKVNCTNEKETCSDIKGYPELKWYRNGRFYEYHGERDHDSILFFISQMTSAPVKKVSNNEDVFQEDAIFDVAFIMYPASTGASTLPASHFEIVAKRFQSLAFSFLLAPSEANDAWVNNFTRHNSKQNDILIRLERDLSRASVYRGDWSVNSLDQFFQNNVSPIVPEMNNNNIERLVDDEKFSAIAVIDPKNKEHSAYLSEFRNYVSNVPPSIKNEFSFVWLNGPDWAQYLERYEIAYAGEPHFLVLEMPYDIYWNLPNDATVSIKNIDLLLTNITNGDAGPPKRVESDDDQGKEEDMHLSSPMIDLFKELRKHPFLWNLTIISSFFLGFILGSTFLPPTSRLAQIMEKYYGRHVDKVLEVMQEKEKED